MGYFPRIRVEPVSLALAGGFFTELARKAQSKTLDGSRQETGSVCHQCQFQYWYCVLRAMQMGRYSCLHPLIQASSYQHFWAGTSWWSAGLGVCPRSAGNWLIPEWRRQDPTNPRGNWAPARPRKSLGCCLRPVEGQINILEIFTSRKPGTEMEDVYQIWHLMEKYQKVEFPSGQLDQLIVPWSHPTPNVSIL